MLRVIVLAKNFVEQCPPCNGFLEDFKHNPVHGRFCSNTKSMQKPRLR